MKVDQVARAARPRAAAPDRLTQSELAAALAKASFELPGDAFKTASTALYPSSQKLGYGVKLEVQSQGGRGVSIASARTSGTSTDSFHKVLMSNGEATYHPNSRVSKGLREAADGSLQQPEVLSEGIAVPKSPKDSILFATPSRSGDLLDVAYRKPNGKVAMESFGLQDSKLTKLTAKEAETLRLGNASRPAKEGVSRGLTTQGWLQTMPREYQRRVNDGFATPAPAAAPAKRPAATATPASARKPAPQAPRYDFYTVKQEQNGTFTVSGGSNKSGVAVEIRGGFHSEADAIALTRSHRR